MKHMKAVIVALAFFLSGCADTHAYLGAQIAHASHLSQHFETPATNYGYDAIEASFRVEHPGSGAFAEVDEGYIFEPRWSRDGLTGAGAMLGPSELTEVRLGYRWKVW